MLPEIPPCGKQFGRGSGPVPESFTIHVWLLYLSVIEEDDAAAPPAQLYGPAGKPNQPFFKARSAAVDAACGNSVGVQKVPAGRKVEAILVVAHRFIGDTARCWKEMDQQNQQYPSVTFMQFNDLRTAKALSLLHEKKAEDRMPSLSPRANMNCGYAGA